MAEARPRWQIVLLPVASIEPPAIVPANVHVLLPKAFEELPDYVAGWDVALLPHGEKAVFELLAAGREVVMMQPETISVPSTEPALVRVARTTSELVEQIEKAIDAWDPERPQRIEAFLDGVFTPRAAPLPAFDARH